MHLFSALKMIMGIGNSVVHIIQFVKAPHVKQVFKLNKVIKK